MKPRNRFQGLNSASLSSLSGQYDNPIPTRFKAPTDCLQIPAQATLAGGIYSLELIPWLHKRLKIRALSCRVVVPGLPSWESIPGLRKRSTNTGSVWQPYSRLVPSPRDCSKVPVPCPGIFKQSMGARNRVGIGLVYQAHQGTLASGIGSLESIPQLHKS